MTTNDSEQNPRELMGNEITIGMPRCRLFEILNNSESYTNISTDQIEEKRMTIGTKRSDVNLEIVTYTFTNKEGVSYSGTLRLEYGHLKAHTLIKES